MNEHRAAVFDRPIHKRPDTTKEQAVVEEEAGSLKLAYEKESALRKK